MQPTRQLIPNFIYEKYRANQLSGVFQGAAMFVDLSGFSTMTDALVLHGAHGAEVLADMMRVVFEPLVSAVYEQGGFVIGYAGDAFNAVFPDQASGLVMQRCLSAALVMQAHTKSHSRISTPYGDFFIRIKVGIGFGETTWQIFKSKDGRRASYWLRGKSLSGAVAGEELAQAGDIVADSAAYNLLKDVVRAAPVGDCFLIEDALIKLPAPHSLSPPKDEDDLVGIFFTEAITRLPIVGEFRQVVNLFIDIPASISNKALVAPFMETVYLLQDQYGGFFLRPDLGDKGFNLLMFWGAPITYENDVERALNFILELSSRTHIRLRAGISYRMAYAGFIGASLREDYTAYGWGVNLAARMMARAGEGEYWMDEEVVRRAVKYFNFKLLGEYSFKGFNQMQKVFALTGRKNLVEAVYAGRLAGRTKELKALDVFAAPLQQGKFAGILILKGEAGMGKSRLVHSFQNSEHFNHSPLNWAVCQADEILRLPFNPFVNWLKRRFGLFENENNTVNSAVFLRKLQELINVTADAELAAELIRTTSVLAALINIRQPHSLYESLDAKGRYENTLIALSALLRAESLQKPLILFVEDVHWLDKASSAFLSYFVRAVLAEPERQYPIAIIASQRPEGDFAHWLNEVSLVEIQLEKLSASVMADLAEDILGQPAADSLLSLLEERADGNPFFAEQILRYLLDQNALTLNTDQKFFANEQAKNSLPTDVRAVLVARLDQLPSQVKTTVQTASALGREFEIQVLRQMLQAERNFSQHITQAQNSNIWAPMTETKYIFYHALLRDAAYLMQLQAHQQQLHGLAVAAIEYIYDGRDLAPHYPELAYHAEKALLREKALYYLNLAGRLSLRIYQNHQSLHYFTRALALVHKTELRARFDILIERVEAYYRISEVDAQSADLTELEELADQLNIDELSGRVFAKRAYYFSSLGEYQSVIEYANKAKQYSESAQDSATLLSIYMALQTALLRTGQIEEATQSAEHVLALARETNDYYGEASALTALGLIVLEREGATVARHYHERALFIAQEIQDRYLEAKILNNLANTVGLSQGDFHAAQDYFLQSLSIFQEYGDLSGKGLITINLGWLAGMLGDYPAAIEYYQQALIIFRKLGNRMEEMYAYINLSAASIAQGAPSDALSWVEQALALSEKIGDRSAAGWAYFYLGYARLIDNQFDLAVLAFLKSIEIRSQISATALIIESRAGLCESYLKAGSPILAQIETEIIAAYLEENITLEGMEEPLRVYLSVINSLKYRQDPRVPIVLQYANQLLEAQVSKLRSEEARFKFVQNVPWRRVIQQLITASRLNP